MPANSWIERLVPGAVRPYFKLARLDRPIGTWLLLFPCWWAIALASPGWPDFRLLGLFTLGAIVMRGAGCTYNDIVDRDFDARVARTRERPLPSGQVTLRGAIVFLSIQLLIGLGVLVMLDRTAILLGVASLLLVFTYPLMKRVTWWPQLFLGLAFNWGALMGWAAVTDGLDWPAILLYAAGIFWTLGYDTIYAHQDKEDDILIGVKSLALRLGEATRTWLYGFYGGAVAFLGLAGIAAGLGWPFLVALAGVGAHFLWQAGAVDLDRPGDCLAKFRSNRWAGWIVFAGILVGHFVR